MTGTVTYTGTTGAGQALSSTVLSDVTNIDFDLAAAVLRVTYGSPSKIAQLDLSLMATVTATLVTGVSAAFTVSS